MQEVLVGFAASLLTQFSKKAKNVPLPENNVMLIRAVVAVLSVIGTILASYASGSLDKLDWKTIVETLFSAASSFLVASGVHSVLLRKK